MVYWSVFSSFDNITFSHFHFAFGCLRHLQTIANLNRSRRSYRYECGRTPCPSTNANPGLLTHSLSVLLKPVDLGHLLLFQIFSALENCLTKVLAETHPQALHNELQGKKGNSNKSLDLGELFILWKSLSLEANDPSRKTSPQGKLFLKCESFIAVIRKQRNLLAHGEPFSRLHLKQTIHVAKRILKQCDSSVVLPTLPTNFERVFSSFTEGKDTWPLTPTFNALVHASGSHTFVSRMFQSSARLLIGRDHILDQLVQLTGADGAQKSGCSRRILLHGPHGVGKTALVRAYSSLVSNIYCKQYSFQADSQQSFLRDIDAFLSAEGFSQEGHVAFHNALSLSTENILLVFEDVLQPNSIIPFLPEGKHCVIFTSLSDMLWKKNALLERNVTSIRVPSLTTKDSLHLMESVFRQCRKNHEFRKNVLWHC